MKLYVKTYLLIYPSKIEHYIFIYMHICKLNNYNNENNTMKIKNRVLMLHVIGFADVEKQHLKHNSSETGCT